MAKTKKKTAKKLKSNLTQEDRASIIAVINKTRDLAGTTLECGSALAYDCHEVIHLSNKLGEQLGFYKEHWYSDFK